MDTRKIEERIKELTAYLKGQKRAVVIRTLVIQEKLRIEAESLNESLKATVEELGTKLKNIEAYYNTAQMKLNRQENEIGQLEKDIAVLHQDLTIARRSEEQARAELARGRETRHRAEVEADSYEKIIDKLIKVSMEEPVKEAFKLIKSLQSGK